MPVLKDPGHRIGDVRAQADEACRRAGRDPRSVTLVAVSKTVDADGIGRALDAGQRVFGENRVQEAKEKWPRLRSSHPDVELHMIGPLQSNKVRDAVALFDVVQSVDRRSLCKALAKQVQAQGRCPKLFVQINVGEEPQKSGVLPEHVDDFIAACRDEFGLDVAGLMCIPPHGRSPEPHFSRLASFAERNGVGLLSMGMSADFRPAIAHGATHVRVGSAIFGARPT
ncbi:MAG TPA: YggS family pyridoxal phosphate-dependent enzyme [Glycomyces sp.]|nr:YggS family pyridoxal phosphate-dependent enzyme [Glycomyces sp.]